MLKYFVSLSDETSQSSSSRTGSKLVSETRSGTQVTSPESWISIFRVKGTFSRRWKVLARTVNIHQINTRLNWACPAPTGEWRWSGILEELFFWTFFPLNWEINILNNHLYVALSLQLTTGSFSTKSSGLMLHKLELEESKGTESWTTPSYGNITAWLLWVILILLLLLIHELVEGDTNAPDTDTSLQHVLQYTILTPHNPYLDSQFTHTFVWCSSTMLYIHATSYRTYHWTNSSLHFTGRFVERKRSSNLKD